MCDSVFKDIVRSIFNNNSESLLKEVRFVYENKSSKELFYSHHLAGFVYRTLEKNDSLRSLDKEIQEELKDFYIVRWCRTEQMFVELKRLLKELEALGFKAIVLKGAPLQMKYYGDLGQRKCSDIDILIAEDRLFEKADNIMSIVGYKRLSRFLISPHLTERFSHSILYFGGKFNIDLHSTTKKHFSWNVDKSRLTSTAIDYSHDNFKCKVLSIENALTQLALSFFADMCIGKVTYADSLDIAVMVRKDGKNINWNNFFKDKKAEGTFKIVTHVLFYISILFDFGNEYSRLTNILKTSCHESSFNDWKFKSNSSYLGMRLNSILRRFKWLKYFEASFISSLLNLVIEKPFLALVDDPYLREYYKKKISNT